MQAATELNRACCDPLIAPACEHARALTELNQAIIVAIETIMGKTAPWMKTPPHYLHPGYKPPAEDRKPGCLRTDGAEGVGRRDFLASQI